MGGLGGNVPQNPGFNHPEHNTIRMVEGAKFKIQNSKFKILSSEGFCVGVVKPLVD
jgi:hypothetical protein